MTDQEHPNIMVHDSNDNSNDQQPAASTEDLLSAQRGTSRKREREPSIEPQTPKSDAGELAATDPNERKPHVAKRNRLEPLDEVESPPRSPPLDNSNAAASAAGAATPPNTTPPLPNADQTPSQETAEPPKLQNIRKRVKDLNWKENGSPVRGGGAAPRPKSIYDTTMEDAEQWDADEEEMDAQQPVGPNEDTVIPDARPATPPPPPKEDVDIGSPQHAATVESEQKPRAEDDSNGKNNVQAKPDEPKEMPPALAPAVDLTETAKEERPSRQHNRKNSDSDPPSDPERTKSPSRKRKLITRETSFANDSQSHHEQYAKRPREKQDDDVSIKTIKEVKEDDSATIPPVPGQTPVLATSPPKPTGFAAFSGVSPFAKVSGNAFGATSSSPNLASKPADQTTTSSSPKPAAPQASKSFSSGFGAFMSSSSPFASIASAVSPIFGSQSSGPPKRSASPDTSSPNAGLTNRSRSPSVGSLNRRKSPPPASSKPKPGAGFGSYNNSNFGFGSAVAKARHSPSPSLDANSKKETGDEEGSEKKKQRTDDSTQTEDEDGGEGEKRGTSWNDLLASSAKGAAGGTEEESAEQQNKKLKVEEIEVHTGEEDEETRHQARGRLFQLSEEGAWKERGMGTLKINVKRHAGHRARLIMRADAVHRVILNAPLFHGMSVTLAQDPKFVKIASLENGKVAQYLFKCLGAAANTTGQELHDQILSYIPPIDQDDEQDGRSADA